MGGLTGPHGKCQTPVLGRSLQMYDHRGVLPQGEAARLEIGRPHHPLGIVAESGRFRGDAVCTRVQRTVAVHVLKETERIRTCGQALAGNGHMLVFHLHPEAREGTGEESLGRGIDGDIQRTGRPVDVAYFKRQALRLRAYRQKAGTKSNQ